MMDQNRAAMRGRQVELEKLQSRLRLKAKGQLKQLALTVNPSLHEIEDMDIPLAAAIMDDLVMIQAELLRTRTRLHELREALDG